MADGETAIVKCGTTAGSFTMEMHRDWSPNGYDRAVQLFEKGFYDGSHFFRVVPNFLVQFGISYSEDKALIRTSHQQIRDDPPLDIKFEPGTISYAGSGDNSRTSQLFIAYRASPNFGREKWETPIGKVTEGFEDVVKRLYSYGDMPPWGKGPVQGKIHAGPTYIEDNFPLTDKFTSCKVQRQQSNPDAPEEANNEEITAKGDERQVSDHSNNDWHREEWKAEAIKREHVLDTAETPGGGFRLKEKLQNLRSKVQEKAANSSEGDLISMGIILVVVVLASITLVILKGKKKAAGKKS